MPRDTISKYWRRIRNDASQKQKRAEAERQKRAKKDKRHDIAAPVESVEQRPNAPNDEAKRSYEREWGWKKGEVIGIWAAAAVGAIAIAWGAYDSSQQRAVMRAQQRPWVYIDDVSIDSGIGFGQLGAEIHFLFKLQNSGTTPAGDVVIKMRMINNANGWPFDLAGERKIACEEREERGTWWSPASVVFPGKPRTIPAVVVMDKSYVDIAANGPKPPVPNAVVTRGVLSPYIVGCVGYRFTWPDTGEHETPFAYEIFTTHPELLGQVHFVIPFSVNKIVPKDILHLSEVNSSATQAQPN